MKQDKTGETQAFTRQNTFPDEGEGVSPNGRGGVKSNIHPHSPDPHRPNLSRQAAGEKLAKMEYFFGRTHSLEMAREMAMRVFMGGEILPWDTVYADGGDKLWCIAEEGPKLLKQGKEAR